MATIVGTPGRDDIVGTKGDDVIASLGGRDDIRARGGDDLICGGSNGLYEDDEGITAGEFISGGSGDDVILGNGGPDQLSGGRGNDVVAGGRHSDEVAGGPGQDRLSGGASADLLQGHGGRDELGGGAGDDVLDGGTGPDEMLGADGTDRLDAGPGDDGLDGGDGHDVADFTDVDTYLGQHSIPITADLSLGTATAPEYFGHDTLTGIEAVWTAGGSDTLIGDDGDNAFFPGLPAYEGGSEDSIDGGAGRDLLDLTLGQFTHWGGVTIDLATGSGSQPYGTFSLTGIEDVDGSDAADVIAGDAEDNRLTGGRGDDSLDGAGGTNTLDGGDGEDTCRNPGPGQMGATDCEA